MKFEKLGQVFNPRDHKLADGCQTHAQSPQVLPLTDGVRVYFSTRSRDPDGGKFKSHISFVEFDEDLRTIRRVADHTVLPLGALGCFDEHGIFPINVVSMGSEIWGYTCGWNRRVSVSVDTSVGLVVSRDAGETFNREGEGPVMGPILNEPFLVGDAFVIPTEDGFRMWYIFGKRWVRETPDSPPDRVYKINQATSENGRDWTRIGGREILPSVLGENECQALPSVTYFGDRYHMVFCFRQPHGFRLNPDSAYRLGYAWSFDLDHWTRDDARLGYEIEPGSWDQDMQCYPHLFVHQHQLYLYYNGNAFGRDGFGLARIVP